MPTESIFNEKMLSRTLGTTFLMRALILAATESLTSAVLAARVPVWVWNNP
jgi:hypothetical protein